jgi:hypothetical protein
LYNAGVVHFILGRKLGKEVNKNEWKEEMKYTREPGEKGDGFKGAVMIIAGMREMKGGLEEE